MQRSNVSRARGVFGRVALVIAGAVLLSCTSPATVVSVLLDTNAPLDRLLALQITVFRGDGTRAPTRTFLRGPGVSDSFATPASFAITRPSGAAPDERARLVVEARVEPTASAPAVIFRRTVRFQFTASSQTWVRVFLPMSCGAASAGCTTVSGAACTVATRCEEQGLTCGDDGQCVAIDVTPSPVAPDAQAPMDAADRGDAVVADRAMDAGAPTDATSADAPEAAMDAGCPSTCAPRANSAISCVSGACTYTCNAGFGDCDGDASNGCESSLETAERCGACGTRCAGATPLCQSMRCVSGCGAQALCGTSCVDTQTSSAHCGGCDRPCTGGQTCVAGACRCPAAQTQCGAACVDLSSNPFHCGICGRACVAGQSCMTGACQCPAGQSLCSGACVDTQSSTSHCGMCGRGCSSGQVCMAGACQCPTGNQLCAGSCVDVQRSPMNCGMCGRTCATGGCNNGECAPANDTCAGAPLVSAISTDIIGTTCGAANQVTNCGMGFPDVFYMVRLPTLATSVRVTAITGGPYIMAMMGSACGTVAVNCASASYSGAFIPGMTQYVGVLSLASCGTFALRFEP